MALTPAPPRVRRRLALYTFDHGSAAGVRSSQSWIDRLKFSLPGVVLGVSCSADELRSYLDCRREACRRLFIVEYPAQRRVVVTFGETCWLFRLKISLSFSDGRWAGAASLELNPTRLFPRLVDHHGLAHDLGRTPLINRQDLLMGPRAPAQTLDGKDNFVPPAAIPAAINSHWPSLTQSYADAVREAVGECLGTAQQFHRDGSPNEWFLRLPPSSAWGMKEVEVYYEFQDPDAPLRVAAISGIARSLAETFSADDHGGRGSVAVPGVARHVNMPSIRLGLGAQDVYLAIYAKASERVRLEVRYKRYPVTRGCRASADQFTSDITAIQDMLDIVVSNATRRANAFLRAYQRHLSGREASLVSLVTALTTVVASTGANPGILNRVLALLIVHGGLSRSTDPDLERVREALVTAHILVAANMALRPRGSEFTLAPAYAASFRQLRETGFQEYR